MHLFFTGVLWGTNRAILVTNATIMQCSIIHNVLKTIENAHEDVHKSYDVKFHVNWPISIITVIFLKSAKHKV